MVFIKMGLNWFEPNNFGQVLVQKFATWLDLFPGWKQRCPSLNQLYNHRSFVSAGHRCKLMRTLCDQRMGVHGSSTMFNRKVRCYLVQISQVSCLRETLWEDHRRKFFPSNLLFYHSAAFHISCAIRLDKKVRNFLQCTRWYTMI